MIRRLAIFLQLLTCYPIYALAAENDTIEVDSVALWMQQIESSLNYEYGTIELHGNAKLKVPNGFKYLNTPQSVYVLSELWGNPADSSVLGVLVPDDRGVMGDDAWLFTISYDPMGYVDDEDAQDIDYDELLKEQQKEIRESNAQRVELGYPPIEFVGWAAHPYYDNKKKVLHWAKELRFGTDSLTTLNYNLRILGRKGVFMLNAVATINQLSEVDQQVPLVLQSVEFEKGFTYFDFDPDVDEVAAWTIGGLVAGKILAKSGVLVLLLKFWKFILVGIAAAGGAILNLFKKKKQVSDPVIESDDSDDNKELKA